MWLLGFELRTFRRAVSALSHLSSLIPYILKDTAASSRALGDTVTGDHYFSLPFWLRVYLKSLTCPCVASCLLSSLQLDLKSVAVFFPSVSGLKDLNILKQNKTKQGRTKPNTVFVVCWASRREQI